MYDKGEELRSMDPPSTHLGKRLKAGLSLKIEHALRKNQEHEQSEKLSNDF